MAAMKPKPYVNDPPPIRGIVRDLRADRVIIEATPAEVAAFARKDVVAFAKQADGPPIIGEDMLLYDAQGRPVAMIEQVDIRQDRVDVSTFDNPNQSISGLLRVDIRARGLGLLKFAGME